MQAEEARKRAKDKEERKSSFQLVGILTQIKNASNDGKFEIIIYERINLDVETELRKLGYNVCQYYEYKNDWNWGETVKRKVAKAIISW